MQSDDPNTGPLIPGDEPTLKIEQAAPRPNPSSKRAIGPLALVLMISGGCFALFLLISSLIYVYRPSGKGTANGKGALFSGNSVGVVELNGVIMDSKRVLKRLEAFEDDDSIKAIVMRLNSPGGAVAPSQEIYQAVKKSSKPIVASMSSVAASGAYYVACGAKKVFANPGTITGSIGVIMEFANLEKLYDWAKVKRYVIKTGKYKDAGAEYREMQPDERALLQGMVDDVLGQFKKAVSDGRKIPLDQVTPLADGRIFSGAQAKANKLVDELGTLDDAINEAARMAGLKGKPNVVYAEKQQKHLLDLILEGGRSEDSEADSISPVGQWLGRVLGVQSESLTRAVTEQATPLLTPGMYWLWRGRL